MKVTEIQMKIIVIGLLPIFIILTITLPNSTGKDILLGGIVISAIIATFIGWKLQGKEAEGTEDDLLALPPKKS